MRRWKVAIAAGLFLSACSSHQPLLREQAMTVVEQLGRQQAAGFFPQEFHSLLETFEHGEAVFHVHEDSRAADAFYQLTLQKGSVLQSELKQFRERRAKEEAVRAKAAEEARLIREAAEAEARMAEQARIKKEEQARAAASLSRPRQHVQESPPQAVSHTVRRGETLPQIAGRTEIYDDASLWPIIYRANRDQIRDPRRLWPGQKLKIPRNFSREEAGEAKRYSGRK